GRPPPRALLDPLALLPERVEHLHAAGLRLRERAEAREPDLPRRFEHGLGQLADRIARRRILPRRRFRLPLPFRLLQHVVLRVGTFRTILGSADRAIILNRRPYNRRPLG